MKRIMLSLLLVLSTILCACSSTGSHTDKETVVLECLVMQSEDHPHSKALVELSETLEKKTRGNYRMTITYADENTAAEDVLLQVQDLNIAFALLPNTCLASCNFEFLLLEHPYFFESPEQQHTFLSDPEISQALYESILADFVRVLGEFYNGTNHLASVDKIDSASALDGKAVYASGTLGTVPLFESCGAVTSTPDVAVVAECNIFDYQAMGLSNTMPHLTLTGHSMPTYALIVNEELWASFSDEVQEIFENAMPKLTKSAMEDVKKLEDEAVAALAKNGNIHTDFDTTSFQSALPAVLDMFQHTEIAQDLCAAKETLLSFR